MWKWLLVSAVLWWGFDEVTHGQRIKDEQGRKWTTALLFLCVGAVGYAIVDHFDGKLVDMTDDARRLSGRVQRLEHRLWEVECELEARRADQESS